MAIVSGVVGGVVSGVAACTETRRQCAHDLSTVCTVRPDGVCRAEWLLMVEWCMCDAMLVPF